MSTTAHTQQTEAAQVKRDDRRGHASPAPVSGVVPTQGLANQLAALQRSAGNRAVQQLLQRRLVDTALQRHPEHAPEVEEIERVATPHDDGPLRRHPEHAPEQEEIERVAAPLVQRWESKKKLKKRVKRHYGDMFGDMPKSLLKRLDEVLSWLPRSHAAGNAALKAIELGQGLVGSVSGYMYEDEKISLTIPAPKGKEIPLWLWLLLDKSWELERHEMDKGFNEGFKIDIDPERDKELGFGKREVLGGGPLSEDNLVDWTVRHEMGHAVDQQIQFTERRGKLSMFGGWRTYDKTGSGDREVATAFLGKAGFSAGEQRTRHKIPTRPGAKAQKKTLLEAATDCIRGGTKLSKIPWLADDARVASFDASVAVARNHPWMLADGGGDMVTHDQRIYHVSHYGSWVSYLAAAREDCRLSNYQFSSPGEWFAEVYAAFYDPVRRSTARKHIPDQVQQWFSINLGEPAFSRKKARTRRGQLTDHKGKLGTLADLKGLDAKVDAALKDPTKTVTVLPDDLKALVAGG